MKNWSLIRTLSWFLLGVVAVHALVIAFHLMMIVEWPVGRALRSFYYSRSPHGVKETWPVIDYYLPIVLLTCVTAGFLRYRSLGIHLVGWVLCCVTILGMLPIYSTRWVPTPVSTWKTPHPAPFQRPPDQSPTLLLASIFGVIARYALRAEEKKVSKTEPT